MAKQPVSRAPAATSPPGRVSVLLVEAPLDGLAPLRERLTHAGCELVVARSGHQALELLQQGDYALCVLPFQQPGLAGLDLARHLRAGERTRQLPLVFLGTPEMDVADIEAGYALGAIDCLILPLAAVILQAKVAGWIGLLQQLARAREEAEQMRLIIQGTTDYAIFMLDPQGRVETWNAGAQRLKQYRAEEIIGRHFSTFYPQEAIDRGWPDHELKVATAEGRFEDEGWRLRKDGSQFWANVVITALRDEQGRLRGFSKVTRDLTARKQAEENARRLAEETAARKVAHEEREWLSVTLASIGDAVIATDGRGQVTFLNGVAQSLTGWNSDEAQGQPLDRVFVILNELSREAVENPVEKVLRDGVIVGLGNHTILVARDGTERPIDDSAAPIRDSAGNLIGVVLIFRDVTEQRRAERELRDSEARKSAVLETALDAIITMNHEGRVVEFNPAAERIFGFPRERLVGKELAEFLIPPALRDDHRRGMAHFLATGEGPVLGRRLELPALRADGSEFPVELSITRITMEGPPLFTAYVRDITETKRAERQRDARLAVTQALSVAATAEAGMAGVLDAVCSRLEWDVGLLWLVNADGSALVCRQVRLRAGVTAAKFEQVSRSRVFSRGEGLPGRVWATGQPAWILEVTHDPNFPRVAAAAAEGLRSAFACPMFVGERFLGVIEFFSRHTEPLDSSLLEMMGTVTGAAGQFLERRRAEDGLREQTATAETLLRVGGLLAQELDLHRLVQLVTDEGTRLCGAQFGAFFYNVVGERGEAYTLYTLSGVPREAFERFPMPRNTALFSPTFRGEGVVRLDDVTQDPRYGHTPPHYGMPEGHLPVRSYLAVPVLSRTGDVLGGLFFGHAEAGVFTPQHERLLIGIAGQAAVGIDNARLHQRTHATAERLNLALTAADLGDWSWDAASDVVTLSERAAELFGLPAGPQMTWTAMQDLLHPADRERAKREVERVIAERAQYAIEYRVNRRDGTQVWVGVLGRAIYDDAGRVIGINGVVQDVTDRKRAEEERKRSEAVLAAQMRALELLVHGAPLPDVLDALCEVVEAQSQEGLIATVLLVDEDGQRLRSAAGRRAPAEYVQAMDGIAIGPGAGSCGTAAFRRAPVIVTEIATDPLWTDYRELALRHGLQACWSTPIFSSRGQVLGTFAVHYPNPRGPSVEEQRLVSLLTSTASLAVERRRDEAALRTSESRFRGLMEQAPFSIQVFAPDGQTIRVNRAWEELWGVTLDQLDGYNILEDPQLKAKGVLPLISKAFAGEPTFIPAIPYDPNETLPDRTRHEDPIRWVAAVAYPLKDDAGIVREIVLVHDDITARRKAEAALRESEDKLRLLADTIPQLAWMARPDGHIFWYNRRWYEYTGTTPEQMEGWGWQSVHDPEELPHVLERWKYSLTTGEPFDMVFPLRGADGILRPFLTRVNPLRNAEGRILYWFGTNTDITELRQAREALADSEERLRLALEAGRMGVWDWNVRTGELRWSDSLEPLHGLAPGTFGGTFAHFQQLIHPDDREAVNAAIQQALERGGEFYVEFRNPRENGGMHWIAGSGKVFSGPDGQPSRMIGIGLDVTPRKRSEQTGRFLADASAALAVLVDFDSTLQKVTSLAVPHFSDWAAVDVLEENGNLRRVAVAHIDPAKVQLARELQRRLPPDPSAPTGVWNILRTGQAELVPVITDAMLAAATQDTELLGTLRELGLKSYLGVPLTVRGKTLGALTFMVAESDHIYDETDLAVAMDLASRTAIAVENTQLYRELRDADRRKDEFLATLAHELRNPLAPIRNGLHVLRLAGGSGEMVDEARAMMERQLAHMVRLVDDLLDVSRITRNKLELRKQRVTLATVIHTAVETSRPLIEEFGHTFSLTLAPTPIFLDADPVRLAQVLSNLLNNAAKYTEPGGQITLTVEQTEAEAVIRVKDNGLGIPAEAQPRVFEMFSQVDRNMERAQGGLGIGLTLVRRLTEMHGGTVDVASDGPGRGSEFTVRIPVLQELTLGPGSKAGAPGGPSPQRRILVVDDNRDAAESLAMMLRLMGNDVRTAHDGLAAVEMAAEYRPDLILLDLGLPRLNGYDACRRIREQPGARDIMLVALTGWGQEEDRRRSQEAGFDHHLVKPVDVHDLTKLLGQVNL